MIKKTSFLIIVTLFFSIIIPACFAYEIDVIAPVTSVIDGDSFYIEGDEVRLADVSCPEWNEYGGSEATEALVLLIEGETVYLDTDQMSGRDSYGRLIAVVYIVLNETHYLNVNDFMLQAGYADLTDYSNNEFSPYSWNLLEPYGVSATSSGYNDSEILSQQLEEMINEYFLLYTEYSDLSDDYETLQLKYEELNSSYLELETAYSELLNEKESSIPGYPVISIIIGLAAIMFLTNLNARD